MVLWATGGLSGPPLVLSGRSQVSLCPTHPGFKKQLHPLPYTLLFLKAEGWQLAKG